MQFRQKALSKLQSPEELDLPVRFARPQGRLVLAVTVVVMAAAATWGFTGSVSSKLSAPGILTRAEGSYLLQSPFAGQVTAVHAKEGQLLAPGAPLLQVSTEQGERTVRAVAGGRVTALVARVGAVVTTGADVATLERVKNPGDPLVAVLYVPAASGAAVPVGATVDLTVQSVPQQRYGVLRGRVKEVGRTPQTPAQIGGFLGDGRLAGQFTAQGNPVQVLVQLERTTQTRSGYRWSSADGPPYALDSTTPVTGAVHLSVQRPVDWLLP
ncbi:HlyD family efflux transporter periplasmic adaptor subunit [Streptomyces sp. NBC_00539]|uniref:HlyD family efflux transporter periplasmic adaptor subunit n=1 Tax=Streptomyces sp. NBC_00539 TaxID=2975770 RepID=UPI002E7FB700|nr:HlyD family efflux transporter periplasmic adaptor subunit [Streptomyces sp. NBC_00539]WUC67972.1 HlyD family efflux transporter periplasmic adaptor subunit [Streptomyces sp. NBC_00539]